mmetsp:Transcript_7496/g.22151  ORF Transcript_7496/g.22151 Transcript_7496/m.22151 type:complete len:213 (-) Transcript_7496:623-1261(-)
MAQPMSTKSLTCKPIGSAKTILLFSFLTTTFRSPSVGPVGSSEGVLNKQTLPAGGPSAWNSFAKPNGTLPANTCMKLRSSHAGTMPSSRSWIFTPLRPVDGTVIVSTTVNQTYPFSGGTNGSYCFFSSIFPPSQSKSIKLAQNLKPFLKLPCGAAPSAGAAPRSPSSRSQSCWSSQYPSPRLTSWRPPKPQPSNVPSLLIRYGQPPMRITAL